MQNDIYEEPRYYCPLMEEVITEEVCYDICFTCYGAPEWTAPKKAQEKADYVEICKTCEKHK